MALISFKRTHLIGIDARMYGKEQTGIGIYIEYLIRELAKIDKNNQYFLFMLEKEYEKFKVPGPNFRKIKVSPPWYSFREQSFFLKDLLRHRLDLVHFPHFNYPIFYPRTFVITVHDITPKFFPGHKMGRSWYRRKGYELILWSLTRKASVIIVPSLKTKNDLIKHFKADETKVRVIPEGIRNKKNPKARRESLRKRTKNKEKALQEIMRKFNFKDIKRPLLFYTGVWRSHKNLPRLIEAFGILINKYNFRGTLILGGKEDKFYPETRRTWEKLKLGERILRPGFIGEEFLDLFYQAADVVVLPSLYEGFGLVPLEALNQATPVACSDIDPLREILGKAAFYFNPFNPEDIAAKLWQLLEDRRFQEFLLQASEQVLKKYDWSKTAKETLEVYNKALKEEKG